MQWVYECVASPGAIWKGRTREGYVCIRDCSSLVRHEYNTPLVYSQFYAQIFNVGEWRGYTVSCLGLLKAVDSLQTLKAGLFLGGVQMLVFRFVEELSLCWVRVKAWVMQLSLGSCYPVCIMNAPDVLCQLNLNITKGGFLLHGHPDEP